MNESEQELCRLLIQLDLLTRDQVNDAFLYLCKLPKSELKPIDDILVELELISPSMLDQVKRMYQQASQIYGHNPLTGRALTHETRPSLQPMPKAKRRLMQAPPKTAELRLTPELQAVIKNGNEGEAARASREAVQDVLDRAQALDGYDTDNTLLIFPGAKNSDDKSEAQVAPTIQAPLPILKNQITPKADSMRTLVMMPEARSELKEKIIQPPPPIAPQPVSAAPKQTPKQTPIHPPMSLSLPDLSAKAPKNSLPQIGEILLKNQDLEEWQLMHALCIQKEAPQATPRLGTLLVKLGYTNKQAIERALSLQLAEELRTETRMVS